MSIPVILAASLAAFDAPISAQRMGNRESNWLSASAISILSFAELKRFSDVINCNLSQIKNADGHDELWRLIDENNHGYGVEVVQQFFEEQC